VLLILLAAVPGAFALICLALPGERLRQAVLVLGTLANLALVVVSWVKPPPALGVYLALDPIGHLFMSLAAVLFLATAVFFIGYHQRRLVSERIFLACFLALLATFNLVFVSSHLGVLWVALESASLAATPLIYFRLGARALEATWKFILMNSVGIALALLGIFCVALSASRIEPQVVLTVAGLGARGAELDDTWLRAGFLLTLVGFGTKMGLAPMHGWKPDTYGEAPPPVAALMAGAMTLAAFLGLLRIFQICSYAGLEEFAGGWFIVFGLLSIATAAIFVINNPDYRRLLAYTSVEHMGVMTLAVGLGTLGAYSCFLHGLHNTLNKGMLFFLAGYLWRMYGSKQIKDVRGVIHKHPLAGVLLMAALCASSGFPPFGMFFSELGILFAAAREGAWWTLALFSVTMCIVFIGVLTAMLPVVFGEPSSMPEGPDTKLLIRGEWRKKVMLAPVVCLAILALGLGAYQPPAVKRALDDAAKALFPGRAPAPTETRR